MSNLNKLKYKFQKGVSLVEGMTAASILGLAVTVFMTLQSIQEKDFANLRKFDKAAYAVELMFEELAAVYNPVAAQYGDPKVFEDTTAGSSLKVKGLAQLPGDGDQITLLRVLVVNMKLQIHQVLMMTITLFLHWSVQMFLMTRPIKIWHQMQLKMLLSHLFLTLKEA